MKKQEKPFFVENLTQELKKASAVVLIDYSGLSVKLQQELKKRLREIDASLEVVKNTLFKLAGNEAKIPTDTLSDTVLSGPTALVVTEADPVAPLSILHQFAKEYDIPKLKVGIIDGVFTNQEQLEILATLPSKNVLQGQVVGSISSPLYSLVSTLQGNLHKLTYLLNEKAKQA